MDWQVGPTAISSSTPRVQPPHLLQVDPIGQLYCQNVIRWISDQFVTSRLKTGRF
jgi:hypothetical protein